MTSRHITSSRRIPALREVAADLVQGILDLDRHDAKVERIVLENQLERRRRARQLTKLLAEIRGGSMAQLSEGVLPKAGSAAVLDWLEEHGRPQSWLAAKCGVTRTTMSLVLGQKREISSRLADAIAEVTGLARDVLEPLTAERSEAIA